MFCNQAKEYLSQKGIQFVDRDITKDAAALEELGRLGYMTTPVIVVDGAVIVGFDTAKLNAALASP